MVKDPYVAAGVGFCALMGAWSVAGSTLNVLGSISRHTLRRPYNMHQRYAKEGKDSWAVVTGGSDGIGLEICHQLAAQGFNICIVSRTQSKIEQKLKEIKEKYPKIRTKAIAFDFSVLCKIEDYKTIAEQLKNIDIAMLFLNAGYLQFGPFTELSEHEIQQTTSVNVL